MTAPHRYFTIEESKAYQIASKASEIIWNEVKTWPWLAKKTLGVQWTEATDSISANLVEGFWRFHKKDRVKFYYNARASAMESAEWAKKAARRKLISEVKEKEILALLEELPKEINFQIKYSLENLKK